MLILKNRAIFNFQNEDITYLEGNQLRKLKTPVTWKYFHTYLGHYFEEKKHLTSTAHEKTKIKGRPSIQLYPSPLNCVDFYG